MIPAFGYRRPGHRRNFRSRKQREGSKSDCNDNRNHCCTRDKRASNNSAGQKRLLCETRVACNGRGRKQRPKGMFHVDWKRKPPSALGKEKARSVDEKNSPARR